MVKKGVAGNMRINVVDVTLDGAYAAGGYALTPAQLGVATVHAVSPIGGTAAGVLPRYDTANAKLIIYKGASTVTVTSGNAAFTELATNDTIISAATVVRLLVVGDNPSG